MFNAENNELLIISLNIIILLITYFYICPRFVGSNIKKLIINCRIAISIALFISGIIFANTNTEFNMLLFKTNWFLFTFITYLIIEAPLATKYIKKHNLFKD